MRRGSSCSNADSGEAWGGGFESLPLLQSAPLQTFSAIFRAAEKPNCRRHSRVRLGGSMPERYGQISLRMAILSPKLGAWPIYSTSFFGGRFSGLASFLSRKVGIPFACRSPRSQQTNRLT